MKTVTVEIFEDDITDNPRLENPIQLGAFFLKRLRERNIPVTGVLFPTGVAFGKLSIYDDEILGAKVFEWIPE